MCYSAICNSRFRPFTSLQSRLLFSPSIISPSLDTLFTANLCFHSPSELVESAELLPRRCLNKYFEFPVCKSGCLNVKYFQLTLGIPREGPVTVIRCCLIFLCVRNTRFGTDPASRTREGAHLSHNVNFALVLFCPEHVEAPRKERSYSTLI